MEQTDRRMVGRPMTPPDPRVRATLEKLPRFSPGGEWWDQMLEREYGQWFRVEDVEKMHPMTAPRVSRWQDIETAPKDGTVILAWSAQWALNMPETVIWLDRGPRAGWFTYAGHHRFMRPPTHWMPLPEPPA